MTEQSQASLTSTVTESGTSAPFSLLHWTVLPDSNELVRELGTQRIVLEPRLMQLLCLLAKTPYRVVSRTELSDQLWQHVIVNENSLTRAVSSLRSKLKPLSPTTTLIETIPKKGYRLNAPIIDVPATPKSSEAQIVIREHRSDTTILNWAPRPLLATAASILLAALLALTVNSNTLSLGPQRMEVPLADILINDTKPNILGQATVNNAVSTGSGDHEVQSHSRSTVFSQDGQFFAYIKPQRNNATIVVGSVNSAEQAVAVFSTQDAISNLQWAPTKRALLFAQSARVSSALLKDKEQESSLVMFDLETFTTKVLDGPLLDSRNEVNPQSAGRSFNLT